MPRPGTELAVSPTASPNNIRVLFLTPYFRPYLGGIERAIEGLAFEYLASPHVEAVGVLTGKYAFPRVPHPDWPDREVTPEGITILRLVQLPPQVPAPVLRSPGVVSTHPDKTLPGGVQPHGSPLRGRWLVLGPPLGVAVGTTQGQDGLHALPFILYPGRGNGSASSTSPSASLVDDVVVPLTGLERERVGKAYRVPEKKVSVIGWGVKPSSVARSRCASRQAVQVLCVGRLGSHKGQMWLLEVYRQARAHFERPVRLVLVGRDEGAEGEIRYAVRNWGLEEEVIITGEVSDARPGAVVRGE